MAHAIPVPRPSALVDHHAVDLERKYTDGWGVRVALPGLADLLGLQPPGLLIHALPAAA